MRLGPAFFLAFGLTLCCSRASGQQKPAIPNPLPEVAALLEKAKDLANSRKYEEARKTAEDALAKAQAMRDLSGQGNAWERVGINDYFLGNLPKALEEFQNAKGFFEQIGDKPDAIGMTMNLGVLNDNMGHPDLAIKFYEEALPLNREIGATDAVGKTLLNLAILYDNLGNWGKELDYAQQARATFKQAKDFSWELSSMNSMAAAYDSLGQTQRAIDTYNEIIRLSQKPELIRARANALGNLGELDARNGKTLEALKNLQESLQLYQEQKDLRFQGLSLIHLGTLYDRMGQAGLAIDSLQQALAIGRKTGDRRLEGTALDNLGVVLAQEERIGEARKPLEEALNLYRQMQNLSGEASCLGTLGAVERKQHNDGKALEDLNEALLVYGKLGYREEQGTMTDSMGNVYLDQGKPENALASYRKALAIYEEIGSTAFSATTLGNLGAVLNQLGRAAEAEACYRKSIRIFEDFRSGLGGISEAKAGYLSHKIGIYRDLISLLVKRGKAKDAFDLVQKTKGRVLLDLLAEGNVSIDGDLSAQERKTEKDLRSQAESLNAAMVKEGAQNEVGAKKRTEAIKLKLKSAETALSQFTATLYVKHPELARKRTATTLTLASVGADLPRDTALLEYVAGDTPLLFVVTAQNHVASVKAYTLGPLQNKSRRVGDGTQAISKPVSQDDLKNKGKTESDRLGTECANFRLACSDPKADYHPLSRSLYEQLIAPAKAQIAGKKRLLVCPDGPLWDVSFAALSSDKGFLADQFEIDYAYSATGHDAIWRHQRSRAARTMLVLANPALGGAARFGDSPMIPGQRPIEPASRPIEPASRPIEPASRPIEPASRPIEPASRDLSIQLSRGGISELPGTQAEADAIRLIFPDATILTREKAQESAFKRLASDYRYLHIASHAFFNDASPMLSSIVLAKPIDSKEDGFLTAREIFAMKLHADLVVLSACNTARGEERSGEGVVGMSWALYAAGVPAQVISQWSVDDQATAQLMSDFYREKSRGRSTGSALRRAELKLINSNTKWRHPYYWAPFVLLGDWR